MDCDNEVDDDTFGLLSITQKICILARAKIIFASQDTPKGSLRSIRGVERDLRHQEQQSAGQTKISSVLAH